jgi:predicted MarR family transcription regulator
MKGTFHEKVAAVHQFIKGYFEQHKAAPRYADICTALRTSPTEINYILRHLEHKRLIERTGTTLLILYYEQAG